MHKRSRPTQPRVSVFDALLIRALVNCAAGLDYESELTDARLLAMVGNQQSSASNCAAFDTPPGIANSQKKKRPRVERGLTERFIDAPQS